MDIRTGEIPFHLLFKMDACIRSISIPFALLVLGNRRGMSELMGSAARLLIADGSPLECEGLKLIAASAMPLMTIDTAHDTAEAERRATEHSYQLAVLDMALPGSHGFSCLLQLQHRMTGVPILLISADWSAAHIEAAGALGASGYLTRNAPLEHVGEAMRRALEGQRSFPAAKNIGDIIARAGHAIRDLSHAQRRVLIALADGRSNKQIAGQLGVTEATIKAHLSAIFRKLGVQNRAQALLAMQPLFQNSSPHPAWGSEAETGDIRDREEASIGMQRPAAS